MTVSNSAIARDGVDPDIAQVRRATAQYHQVEAAISAGYELASPCVASPTGTMGFHYVNNQLADQDLQITAPEALLYTPSPDGLKLVAVEYLSTAETRPDLFGTSFDNGPPGGPPFSLHLWLWNHNPAGMFAPSTPPSPAEGPDTKRPAEASAVWGVRTGRLTCQRTKADHP